jgi:hypothetical protein
MVFLEPRMDPLHIEVVSFEVFVAVTDGVNNRPDRIDKTVRSLELVFVIKH